MNDCCHHEITPTDSQKGMRIALQKALAVNAGMFMVEVIAAIYTHSLAILADSMDFLSDSASFILGIYALNKSQKFRAYFALLNAAMMFGLGVTVMYEASQRFADPVVPNALWMGSVGGMALVANLLSAWWLYKHREGDSLQQSFWLCSRNDALNNIAVIAASVSVYYTQSHWPDITIALLLLTLEIQSAYKVSRKAIKELKEWGRSSAG